MRFSRWIPVLMLLVLPLAGWGDDYVDDVYYWAGATTRTTTRTKRGEAATITKRDKVATITSDTIWSQPSDTVVTMTIRTRK